MAVNFDVAVVECQYPEIGKSAQRDLKSCAINLKCIGLEPLPTGNNSSTDKIQIYFKELSSNQYSIDK